MPTSPSKLQQSDDTHQHRMSSVTTPEAQAITESTVRSESNQHTAQHHLVAQQNHQHLPQSYSNHPILELGAFVKHLSDRDAKIAPHLFALVREDHERSGGDVEELKSFFAPLRKQFDEEFTVANEKLLAFEKAEGASLDYEALVGDLEGAAAEDARVLLRLLQRNSKDGQRSSGDLHEIF
jgi:hypothetical protein